jgi:tetratricopeptide (TPR) repeat protein
MGYYGHVLAAVLVLASAVLARPPCASAQDDRESAKSHFSRGTRLYEVGEYRQAMDEFKAAHLAKPDPAFLYNIAQCHRQLGELEQAVVLYKRFLAASPNAANRAEVETRVAEMETELAARKRKADSSTPLSEPGVAAAASAPPQTAPLPAEALQAASGSAPPVAAGLDTQAAPPPAAPPRTGSTLRTLRWVGVGVTAVLVGGAIGTGIWASSQYDDMKNGCARSSTGCEQGEIDGLKARALLTNVLWGAAGVAAVGTGLAFLLTPQEGAVQVAWRF